MDFLTGTTCLSDLVPFSVYQGSSFLALAATAVFRKLKRMCFKSVTMFEDVAAVELSSGTETSNLEVGRKLCNRDTQQI
jgi:hypothetical protein